MLLIAASLHGEVIQQILCSRLSRLLSAISAAYEIMK